MAEISRPPAVFRLFMSDSSKEIHGGSGNEDISSYVENSILKVENKLMGSFDNAFQKGILTLAGTALFFKLALLTGIVHGNILETIEQLPWYAWHEYEQVLATNPVATKAFTSATVYTIGDVIAQRTEDSNLELDHMRVLRSMIAGLVGHGPLSHVWYNLCEGVFHDVLHWTAWWVFLPKIVVDQAMFGPFWNNTYILLLGLMKKESLETIWEDMKKTTIPLVLSGLKLWPFVHCITYGLIPVENRLLWVDAVEILWVTILATQAAKASKEHDAETLTETNVAAFEN
jgi:protein Mpv17